MYVLDLQKKALGRVDVAAHLLARRDVGVAVLETHHGFARAFRGTGDGRRVCRTGLMVGADAPTR